MPGKGRLRAEKMPVLSGTSGYNNFDALSG
jgi:hypothetical protein